MPFWWHWEVRECVVKVLGRMVMRAGTRNGRVERDPMVFCTPASRSQILKSPEEPKSQVFRRRALHQLVAADALDPGWSAPMPGTHLPSKRSPAHLNLAQRKRAQKSSTVLDCGALNGDAGLNKTVQVSKTIPHYAIIPCVGLMAPTWPD